jgi:DNA-binding YbaB/EbfC family protein
MLGGLGNMFDLVKNARDMQARVREMQEELAKKRFDAQTGGGAVRVTVDGRGTLVAVFIEPSATADLELLEDLIRGAVNAAVARSQDAMKEELARLTGGLNLPGLEAMLGAT